MSGGVSRHAHRSNAALALVEPNTTAATTQMMLAIARQALAGAATIDGMTAAAGAPIITDPAALAVAAAQVLAMVASAPPEHDGILIAAFGDPGLAASRALPINTAPVTGLAEAAILEALAGGGRFAIVTTTPALDTALRARIADQGAAASFVGIRYTRSGIQAMSDPARLRTELLDACRLAIAEDGAEAIIIGGGPLAAAASRLRGDLQAELIEPIPAAMRLMLARARRLPSQPARLSSPGT